MYGVPGSNAALETMLAISRGGPDAGDEPRLGGGAWQVLNTAQP